MWLPQTKYLPTLSKWNVRRSSSHIVLTPTPKSITAFTFFSNDPCFVRECVRLVAFVSEFEALWQSVDRFSNLQLEPTPAYHGSWCIPSAMPISVQRTPHTFLVCGRNGSCWRARPQVEWNLAKRDFQAFVFPGDEDVHSYTWGGKETC